MGHLLKRKVKSCLKSNTFQQYHYCYVSTTGLMKQEGAVRAQKRARVRSKPVGWSCTHRNGSEKIKAIDVVPAYLSCQRTLGTLQSALITTLQSADNRTRNYSVRGTLHEETEISSQ